VKHQAHSRVKKEQVARQNGDQEKNYPAGQFPVWIEALNSFSLHFPKPKVKHHRYFALII